MTSHPTEEQPVINQLREEYFEHLPEIRRVVDYLEAEVRCHIRHILLKLKPHEQLLIKSRVKECESAIQALRRRQEGGTFGPEKPELYSLLHLPDLAGVRVLGFPRSILDKVDDALRELFCDWSPDPVLDDIGAVLAHKYSGKCLVANSDIRAEYQVVPMLIGLYWDVEHSAIYKPAVKTLKDKAASEPMQNLNADVVRALLRFEEQFERLIKD